MRLLFSAAQGQEGAGCSVEDMATRVLGRVIELITRTLLSRTSQAAPLFPALQQFPSERLLCS